MLMLYCFSLIVAFHFELGHLNSPIIVAGMLRVKDNEKPDA